MGNPVNEGVNQKYNSGVLIQPCSAKGKGVWGKNRDKEKVQKEQLAQGKDYDWKKK